MKENKLVELSMEFSVDIINLVKFLKLNHETIISNQIGRSGTSIGANIHEAHMRKVRRSLYPNLKLRSKKQVKRVIGLSSYTGRSISMSKLSKRYPPNALL